MNCGVGELQVSPGIGRTGKPRPQQAVLAGVEEGESGFTAKPCILGEGVNCGVGELQVSPWNRANRQDGPASCGCGEGESGFTAKP